MNLDSIEEIKKIDERGVYDSIVAFPLQAKQAWDEVMELNIPESYTQATNLIFAGMGGSNLGFRIVSALFQDQLPIPVTLVNHYQLPAFANEKTLVIVSSYSGNTEETLMLAEQANKKKCKLIALTTGGQLVDLAGKYNFPFYQINPKHNPAGQPRLGIGYSVFAQIALFAKLGLIKVEQSEIDELMTELQAIVNKFKIDSIENNIAKELAKKIQGKIPIWVAAEHLSGNARVANNQVNENAKNFSGFYTIPELNHHLMEGLKYPESNKDNFIFLGLLSKLYHPRIQKRFAVTKDVVEKNGLSWISYQPNSKNKLGQACESLLFSMFLAFYLAMLAEENPAPIPWVDYFKEQLGKA